MPDRRKRKNRARSRSRRSPRGQPPLLGRWYRREHGSRCDCSACADGKGYSVRSPYEVDLESMRIKYRERRTSSGCSASAWRSWSSKAELMPEGWVPEGVDDWEPK